MYICEAVLNSSTKAHSLRAMCIPNRALPRQASRSVRKQTVPVREGGAARQKKTHKTTTRARSNTRQHNRHGHTSATNANPGQSPPRSRRPNRRSPPADSPVRPSPRAPSLKRQCHRNHRPSLPRREHRRPSTPAMQRTSSGALPTRRGREPRFR